MDTQTLLIIIVLVLLLAEAAGTAGDAGLGGTQGAVADQLEFNDAAPSGMMLSDHAARSSLSKCPNRAEALAD